MWWRIKHAFKSIFSFLNKPEPKAQDIVVQPIKLPKTEEPIQQPPSGPVVVPLDQINDGNTRNPDWTYLWDNCKITNRMNVDWAVKKILANKDKYLSVEKATGVPWKFIACMHYRESTLDFTKYLGNGQPLNRVTTWVPRGRGPFKSWEAGAIDALRYDKIDKRDLSTYAKMCQYLEVVNGLGYRNKGIYSPYVWSGTNWYTRGKYVSDGKYNPFFVDKQLGVAVVLKELEKIS